MKKGLIYLLITALLFAMAVPFSGFADDAAEAVDAILISGSGKSVIEADCFDGGEENYHDNNPEEGAHDSRPDEHPQTQQTGGYIGRDDIDVENNYCIGWISAGEWIQYTVTVEEDGLYKFSAWIASDAGTPDGVELYYNDVLIGYSGAPAKNGWQNYSEYKVGNIDMAAGIHVIRVEFKGGMNLDAIIVERLLGYGTLAKAAEGKNLIANPQYIKGGEGFGNEGSDNLFTTDTGTKYCTNQLPYWAEWKYGSGYIVDGIILATAGDSGSYPRRMGDGWTLSGSHDGTNWNVIYTGSADDVANQDVTFFKIDLSDNENVYKFYKIYAEEGADGDLIQMSVIALSGTPVSTYPLSVLMGIAPPADSLPLVGEPFGTTGWGGNENADFRAAFDGDITTFFDPEGVAEEGQYFTAMGLSRPCILTEVRIHPRTNFLDRFLGATIQGSNDGEEWATLWVSEAEAGAVQFQIITADMLENNIGWAYYRYVNAQKHGDVAEVEFWGKPALTVSEIVGEIANALNTIAMEMLANGIAIDDSAMVIVESFNEMIAEGDMENEFASRQEMALILGFVADYLNMVDSNVIEASLMLALQIADMDAIEEFVQEYVLVSVALGFMELTDGKFNPEALITADDLAVILSVPIKLPVKKSGDEGSRFGEDIPVNKNAPMYIDEFVPVNRDNSPMYIVD